MGEGEEATAAVEGEFAEKFAALEGEYTEAIAGVEGEFSEKIAAIENESAEAIAGVEGEIAELEAAIAGETAEGAAGAGKAALGKSLGKSVLIGAIIAGAAVAISGLAKAMDSWK
jgi:gas vesicle protein